MNTYEKRAVVIIERRYAVDATGSVKKTAAGKTVFECDFVFLKNRTAGVIGIRTDDPVAGSIITVFRIGGKY